MLHASRRAAMARRRAWRCAFAALARARAGHQDRVPARLALRRPGGAVPAAQGQGLFRGGEARRHGRRRQRLGQRGQSRRVGHLPDGLRGPRGADRVRRQQSDRAEQARRGDDGVRLHAGRRVLAQEDRHQDARRPAGQEDGRAGVRCGPARVPDLRQGQQARRRARSRGRRWTRRCARRCSSRATSTRSPASTSRACSTSTRAASRTRTST